MIFYIILFSSLYIALSVVTVYGIIERWYWLLIAALVFLNVFIIGFVLHFIYCAFLSLFVNINKPIKKQNRYYYHLLVQTAFLVIKVFRVKVHITGKEFIPEKGNFLFVCNHIHWLDPAVPLLLFKKRHIAFISKKETHSYPVAGPFLHEAACLPIDRENDREALKTINHASAFIENGICSIGIYPEGRVSKTGELLEFRHGAFRIAKKAECPVLVAKIGGTDKILKKPLWKKCDVYLEIKGFVPEEFIREHKTIEISNLARKIMTE